MRFPNSKLPPIAVIGFWTLNSRRVRILPVRAPRSESRYFLDKSFAQVAAKVPEEPEMTNAALWTKVWFVRNRIKDNQSLAENDHLHASANTLL
jgi:hypothetical protein